MSVRVHWETELRSPDGAQTVLIQYASEWSPSSADWFPYARFEYEPGSEHLAAQHTAEEAFAYALGAASVLERVGWESVALTDQLLPAPISKGIIYLASQLLGLVSVGICLGRSWSVAAVSP